MARSILLLAIGSKHDADLRAAIERYEVRLRSYTQLDWQLLPYSQQRGDAARREESARLGDKLRHDDYVVLLDERGVQLTSEALAAKIESVPGHFRIVFVIGGAYGVDETIRQRAQFVWSLSKLVFPHQLVRLLLIEQLYRAEMISRNHPYHHQ